MSELNEMYIILEDMVKSAEQGKGQRVLELHHKYWAARPKSPPNVQPPPIQLEYDNCEQSCYLSFTSEPHRRKTLLADAKQRFFQIRKP